MNEKENKKPVLEIEFHEAVWRDIPRNMAGESYSTTDFKRKIAYNPHELGL